MYKLLGLRYNLLHGSKICFFAIHARMQSSHRIMLIKSIKHARHDSTTHNPNCQIESAIGRAVSDEKDKTLKR